MANISIVQARTGSTRLPGKVLMKLDDKTVLEHVIEQLQKSNLDRIIIATSNKEQDNEIETLANKINIEIFRGDEDNVMKRYLDTAEKFNIQDTDLIIRITADCPLINEKIINEMLNFHNGDYTYNNVSKSMIPRGFDVEIFSLNTLKKAYQEVDKLPEDKKKFYQEHVSKYLADNPDSYKHNLFTPCHELKRPDLNFSIDTKEDFERVQKVLEQVKELTPKNIAKLFPKPEIAIYAVSTPEIGTGHLTRMIILSDILKDKIDCSVTFYVNDIQENKDLLKNKNFKAIDLSKDNVKEVVQNTKANIHIIDIMKMNEKFQDNVIIIDTPFDKEDRIIIKNVFKRRNEINKEVKNILVTMGGSDPDNATENIVKALQDKENITVILGPMFKDKDEIKQLSNKITFLENVNNMQELINNADIGIGSAGATIREMIFSGLPSISIAVSEQQIPNTTAVGKNGYAIDIQRNPTQEQILTAVNKLENYETRKDIYEKQAQYKPDTEEIINEIITCLIP